MVDTVKNSWNVERHCLILHKHKDYSTYLKIPRLIDRCG